MSARRYRAGESIEDYCRACKTDRIHTVIVVDGSAVPLRVMCDYCRSEHNFRGGPRISTRGTDSRGDAEHVAVERRARQQEPPAPVRGDGAAARDTFPLVSDRERTAPPMPMDSNTDLELLLRRIIREETGLTAAAPAEKWRGGSLVLRPGAPGLQEKSWPVETFFHKIVMLRNRLRTLEQHVNASELPADVKIKLQGYITGCYGSLTSFNVLFADEADQFKGSGGE
jgi:hypothetical protein